MTTLIADRMQEARLKEAMERADAAAMNDIADEIGREAVTRIVAQRPPAPTPEPERPPPPKNIDEERQRILDALAGDLDEVANRHRARLGRRVCSAGDAKIKRIAFEQFRSMAGPEGGADNDPTWQ